MMSTYKVLRIIFILLLVITFVEVGYYLYFLSIKKRGDINLALVENINKLSATKISCPDGFIHVPGNMAYQTKDFCVMKYEAKCDNDGDGKGDVQTDPSNKYNTWNNVKTPCISIVSSSQGSPITNISLDIPDGTNKTVNNSNNRNSAKDYCAKKGWHLLKNSEYMTVASSIFENKVNWCSVDNPNKCNLEIGQGAISSGHSNESPQQALEASRDDALLCFKTGTESTNSCLDKDAQKRAFILNNSEVIWDIAGNVWEIIDKVVDIRDLPVASSSAGVRKGYGWSNYIRTDNDNNWYISDYKIFKQTDFVPEKIISLGINGMGQLSHFSEATIGGNIILTRGGAWTKVSKAGLFTAAFITTQFSDSAGVNGEAGFRCVSDVSN